MNSWPSYPVLLLSAQQFHQANLDFCISSGNWEIQSNIRIEKEITHSACTSLYNFQLDFVFLEPSADLIQTKYPLSNW